MELNSVSEKNRTVPNKARVIIRSPVVGEGSGRGGIIVRRKYKNICMGMFETHHFAY